jgi:guanylate kinase
MGKKRGKIIVIVAPSGTGKSTLLEKVKKAIPELVWSVSCTTRPMREGEINGKDYFFVKEEDFKQKIQDDAFIEWAKVHSNYYGTLKSFVDEGLSDGKYLLFDLDVQGCDSVKKLYGDEARVIFIEPPSVKALEERLLNRATDSNEVIQERLKNALHELERKNDFDYNVVNDDIEKAYQDLKAIINKELGK